MKVAKKKNPNGKLRKKEDVYVSFSWGEFKKFSNNLLKIAKAIDKAKKRVKVAGY
jgi:hypothetical protein